MSQMWMGVHFVTKTMFLFVNSMEQKILMDEPVIFSLSKVVLDAHVESFEFLKVTWLKMSGALCM